MTCLITNLTKKKKLGFLYVLNTRNFLLVALAILLNSCYSSKKTNYLQSDQFKMHLPVRHTSYMVQPNDILDIKVQTMDPDQSSFFNLSSIGNSNRQDNPASLFLAGNTVNSKGTISLAMIGELQVKGLTVDEIQELVQKKIDNFLVNATVTVKLTSFKISVLGDVKNPGTNYVYNSQATIFEALSAAGDLNISGKRRNVRLIRQKGNQSEVVKLDLTDPKIISSPYYYLHPNDVLYVEPSKELMVRENLGLISIFLTAISTTVLVLNLVINN